MSAIFGIINKKNEPVSNESIHKIQQVILHRATDGSGLWKTNNVALGHCKLIVYPQQINEQLPVETTDFVLTADARIDNRDELYNLLNLDKQQCAAEPDSYLILKAYQKWGEQCVDHLEGEYVFAIWNKTCQQLFMVTDHIGFRPVFYYDSPDQFIFCSEIKGIVATKTTPNYFNEVHLIEYHFQKYDAAATYNKEIFALHGGSTLNLADNKVSFKKYWSPKPIGKYHFTKDEEWTDCLKDLLYKSVEKRLNPDVPVGVTLSGGLDSTSIACILSELLAKKNKPLYAFSSVLPLNHGGIDQDEREYIAIVNKHCPNIVQTFVEANGVGPLTNVADAFEKEEGIPNAFFYMNNAILTEAQHKNIRILFTGYGGDYSASWKGNTVIYQLLQQGKFKMALTLLKAFSKNDNKNLLQLIKSEYAAHTVIYQQLSKLIRHRQIDWQRRSVLRNELTDKYLKEIAPSQTVNNSTFMTEFIQSGRLSRMIGMPANRGAHYNIATCDPMLDKEVLTFLMEVPMHLFNKNGYKRSLLRHAMAGVIPSEIQWRKDKLPFAPAYRSRIINQKEIIDRIINLYEYKFIFDKYIEKEMIVNHFNEIRPRAGFTSSTKIMIVRMIQAGVSCMALNYLDEKKYFFD
jgi:asparagine synthase (glutamine-hydrolysing)